MQLTDKPAYTLRELADLTGLSRQTLTRLFDAERGVIVISRPERTHKRGYRTIRIPRAVAERVLRKVIQ